MATAKRGGLYSGPEGGATAGLITPAEKHVVLVHINPSRCRYDANRMHHDRGSVCHHRHSLPPLPRPARRGGRHSPLLVQCKQKEEKCENTVRTRKKTLHHHWLPLSIMCCSSLCCAKQEEILLAIDGNVVSDQQPPDAPTVTQPDENLPPFSPEMDGAAADVAPSICRRSPTRQRS